MADRYASLKQGLVGCWIPSISGSGLLLPDLSGRGNNGALTNMDASDWVSSQYGRALDFDYVAGATRQAVELSNNVSVRGLATASLSFWCNLQAAPANNAGLFYESTASNGFTKFGIFQTPANALLFVARDTSSGSSFSITHTPAASQWLHVVGNYNSNSDVMELFVNGVSVGTNTTAKGVFVNEAPATTIAIGAYTDSTTAFNYSCNALVDDVRLYSRALTESEIRLLSSEPGIGFKPAKKLSRFSQRFTYNPPKARNYGVVRVKETDYATLRQGLVGAWCPSLPNGGSGNTLPDVSGFNNHGVLTNMGPEDWVSGQYGRALDFDGVNDYVTTADSTFDFTDKFAITFWCNIRGGRIPLSKGDAGSTGYNFDFSGFTANQIEFLVIAPSGSYISRGFTNPGGWVHVVGMFDSTISGTGRNMLFINGIQRTGTVVSAGTVNAVSTNNSALIFGTDSSVASFFNGQLDDVRAYNRILTEPEIRLLASRPGIGLRQDRDRNTFYQFPSFQPALARRSSAIIGGGIT